MKPLLITTTCPGPFEPKRQVSTATNVPLSQRAATHGSSDIQYPSEGRAMRLTSCLILGASGGLTGSMIAAIALGNWIYTISFGFLGGLLGIILSSLLCVAGNKTNQSGQHC